MLVDLVRDGFEDLWNFCFYDGVLVFLRIWGVKGGLEELQYEFSYSQNHTE